MRQIILYANIFNKQNIANKIAFIWTLILPIIFFIVRYNPIKTNTGNSFDLYSVIYFYWAFMVLITVINGVVLTTINYRDSGFLKSFSFISGNKYVIIFGQMVSQLLYILVLMNIFNLFISIIYKYNLFQLMDGILVITIAFIPICFSMLWILIIPTNADNLAPIATILVFLFLFLSNLNEPTMALAFFYNLNPVVYLENIRDLIYELNLSKFVYTTVTTIVYLNTGLFSLKKTSIAPITIKK